MAVTLTQNPGDYNLAYGANAVTMQGLPQGALKYVLQVWDSTLTQKLADIRQTPNQEGRAVFDIQQILQSYLEGSNSTLETVEDLRTSADETIRYYIKFGSEGVGGSLTIDGTSTPKEAFGGRKEYYEIDWNFEDYQAEVSGDDSVPQCAVIDSVGKAMTDKPTVAANSLSGFNPFGAEQIHNYRAALTDNLTVSYLSKLNRDGTTPADTQGIEQFYLAFYNGDNFISATTIDNTEANGGGPNNVFGDGEAVTAPYSVISIGAGPANLTVPANTTHYYIQTRVYSDCTPGDALGHAHTPVRVDIVEPKCNDYDHIQVSWTNSLGFRDYYTFTKKNERRVQARRNTYLQESADYASDAYTTARTDRGFKTFSQTLDLQYTADTDWVSDADAKYLENLYLSPDVRVNIGGQGWEPVVLLSNSYVERNYRKDRLFQYTIQFKRAHNLKSQRG